jgi:hypothetical protein
MNTSTTRWLILITAALAAFIFFYERPRRSADELASSKSLVIPALVPQEVDAITILQQTNLMLKVERTNQHWELAFPIRYPAQAAGVERLLDGLANLRSRTVLSASDLLSHSNTLGAFGLEPPSNTVVLQQKNSRHELRLGITTPLGGEVYAQVVGREGLVTVDGSVRTFIPASVEQWRDTALANLAGLEFNRIEFKPITNGFEVIRDPTNRAWQITRPLPLRANSAKLEGLLQRLDLVRVAKFVTDDPRADLEPYGLQPPEREIVLARGTNEVLTLQFGRSPTNAPDQIFARRLANSNVVLVPRAEIEPWLGGFRDFCDRRLMVFDVEKVTRIVAKADEEFVVQKQGERSWSITTPYPAPADHLLVLEMLASLADLEFIEFEREVATDFAPYGLDPPRRRYRLETTITNANGTATNQPIAQLDIGTPTTYKFFARRNSENSVVTMLDTGRIPRAAYELRDRLIWDFSTNQIAAITIRQMGVSKRLLRTGPAQWTIAPDSPRSQINPFALEEAAYQLGRLHAAKWVARGEEQLARYGFASIDHEITLELTVADKPEKRTLRVGRRTPIGNSAYAAVVIDGQTAPVVFELRPRLYELIQSELTAGPPAAGAFP